MGSTPLYRRLNSSSRLALCTSSIFPVPVRQGFSASLCQAKPGEKSPTLPSQGVFTTPGCSPHTQRRSVAGTTPGTGFQAGLYLLSLPVQDSSSDLRLYLTPATENQSSSASGPTCPLTTAFCHLTIILTPGLSLFVPHPSCHAKASCQTCTSQYQQDNLLQQLPGPQIL